MTSDALPLLLTTDWTHIWCAPFGIRGDLQVGALQACSQEHGHDEHCAGGYHGDEDDLKKSEWSRM